MKSNVPFPFIGFVFCCLLAFSCEKNDPYDYYGNQVFVRAVPENQRVKLYFYLCNYNDTNFPIVPGFACPPEVNARFEVYQMNPDGTEKKRWASNVADSFYVEGLPNGENAYFKIKARVGRTRAGESDVVIATPDAYPVLERLTLTQPGPFSGILSYSPDFNKIVQAVYLDTFSGTEVRQLNPPEVHYTTINFAGPINWDVSSRYFMGTTNNYGGSASIYFTDPYLYDTETDTLTVYKNLGSFDFQAPFLAADQQHFYFLSNEHNSYEYSLWVANLDGSQKRRVTPGFKFTYATRNYLYNQSNIYLSGSDDGTAVYASFDTYFDKTKQKEDGLYQINTATGDFVQLLDGQWRVLMARPSPDHRQVVFISSVSGESAFWSLDLSTGKVRQVATMPANVYLNTLTPIHWIDNQHIYASAIGLSGYIHYKIAVNQ